MTNRFCPPPVCMVPPVIRHQVWGSGRLFQPAPLSIQAPGYAYLGGDQQPCNPLVASPQCGPAGPCGLTPPPGAQTTVVGAGILSPVKWRGNGIFADNYALPGDIAREPDEGWWASETVDAETGGRSWITAMSGLGVVSPVTTAAIRAQMPGVIGAHVGGPARGIQGPVSVSSAPSAYYEGYQRSTGYHTYPGGYARGGAAFSEGGGTRHTPVASLPFRSVFGLSGGLGAITGWFNDTFVNIGGLRIPNWLGWGALALVAYKVAKKKGLIKNPSRRSRRRRNVSGTLDEHAARELELYIENDGDLYRQQYQPILKNLATKVARGVYDHAKAVKLFMYLANSGAQKYVKEYGSSLPWHEMFNTATRRAVAESLTRSFETENALGNYSSFLPKKYQPKANRRRYRRSR